MTKHKVLVLVHEYLVPPEKFDKSKINRIETEWITEHDVISTLNKTGHEVRVLGVLEDLDPIKKTIEEFKPYIVFIVLEEFQGQRYLLHNLLNYLELLGVRYTGCNPMSMALTTNKALAKKLLSFHKINTPEFYVFKKNSKVIIPKDLKFPLIVKCLTEEGSLGLAQASIVHNKEKLKERIKFVHNKINDHVIVEEFIEGRELFAGVIGNKSPKVLPIWELVFNNADHPEKEIYSSRAKMSSSYRAKKGIKDKKANLTSELEKKIIKTTLKTYKVLNISGYARLDLRVTSNGTVYVIEVNPNPDLAFDDEFARSAEHFGISYSDLLERIIKLGKSWRHEI